jgi:adenylate kinase
MAAFKPQAYIFIGPPACGKGTYGKALGMIPGFCHFSMGSAFRRMDSRVVKDADLLGRIQSFTSRGELVPDGIVMEVFARHLEKLEASGALAPQFDALILDGIPRTRGQAEALVKMIHVRRVFHFECDRDEIRRRVKSRAMAEGRADDTAEVLERRLASYEREAPELLAFYTSEVMIDIDTTGRPARTLESLAKAIE